ncbi:MAG: GNAT family N-acyltransferase [Acidobacteriota bacterium]
MSSESVTVTAPYPVAPDSIPQQTLVEGHYEVRFARTLDELDAILRLRFEVFNVELGEGLDASWKTGLDRDPFDAVCHHLCVLDRRSGEIVGTYRIQTVSMAEGHLGLYSDLEFDLSAVPAEIMDESAEVGRACVALSHRNTQVLFLLWRGLALYLESNRLRYLFGCCSLTSQDPAEGLAVMRHLEAHGHVHPDFTVQPRAAFECYRPADEEHLRWDAPVHIPKLFRIYLRHGARVCGPPAIDRDFKTIDYLVLFDVAAMDEKRARTFFG